MAAAHECFERGLLKSIDHRTIKRIAESFSEAKPTPGVWWSSPRVVICVIPDAHDSPELGDKRRFTWMGRWVADRDPDYVVQLGDIASFDSVTRHAPPGSLEARGLPTLKDDLYSLNEALHLFNEPTRESRARKIITLGNHENRIWRMEDSVPALSGLGSEKFANLLETYSWDAKEYKAIHMIGGVGFTHHPTTGDGRAYGGKTAVNRVLNDLVFSLVHGHTHARFGVDAGKIGAPEDAIRCISAGCALPWGHVEPYARHSKTGWWWGCLELTIEGGVITDERWISMRSLARLYQN